MASGTTYTVQVKVEAGGAVANLNDIDKAIESSNSNLISMRKELKDVQSQLLALEPGSKQFDALAARAGKLRDQLNNVSQQINANAAPALESVGNQATILRGKLTSLDFAGVGESFKSLGSSIGRVSFKDAEDGIRGMASGFISLGRALLANPLFLVAGAIGGIVLGLQAWRKAALEVDSVLAATLDTQQRIVAAQQADLDSALGKTEQLRLQGKSEREILEIKKAQTTEVIAALEAQLITQEEINNQQIEAAKKGKEILTGIIKFITAPLQLLLNTVDQIGKVVGQNFNLAERLNDFTANLLFDPKQVEEDGKEAIAETRKQLAALEEARAGYQNQINAIDKAGREQRDADAQKELDRQQKILEAAAEAERKYQEFLRAANNDRLDDVERVQEAIFQASLSEQERELQAVRDKYFELNELAIQNGLDNQALLDQQLQEEQEIKEKYEQQDKDRKDRDRQHELEQERALQNAKLEVAQNYVNAAQAVNELLVSTGLITSKKAFNIAKGLGIAEATISTIKGVVNALSAPTIVPDPIGTILKAANAVAIGIAGAAQIAKISRTQFNPAGGSGGGGGGSLAPSFGSGGGGGSSPSPSFSPLNTEFLQNRPPQQPVVKTYVLSSDVASEEEANEKITALSTFE